MSTFIVGRPHHYKSGRFPHTKHRLRTVAWLQSIYYTMNRIDRQIQLITSPFRKRLGISQVTQNSTVKEWAPCPQLFRDIESLRLLHLSSWYLSIAHGDWLDPASMQFAQEDLIYNTPGVRSQGSRTGHPYLIGRNELFSRLSATKALKPPSTIKVAGFSTIKWPFPPLHYKVAGFPN